MSLLVRGSWAVGSRAVSSVESGGTGSGSGSDDSGSSSGGGFSSGVWGLVHGLFVIAIHGFVNFLLFC